MCKQLLQAAIATANRSREKAGSRGYITKVYKPSLFHSLLQPLSTQINQSAKDICIYIPAFPTKQSWQHQWHRLLWFSRWSNGMIFCICHRNCTILEDTPPTLYNQCHFWRGVFCARAHGCVQPRPPGVPPEQIQHLFKNPPLVWLLDWWVFFPAVSFSRFCRIIP